MKKTMKYLSMAAFVLVGVVMASCSSSDSGIEEKPQQPAEKKYSVTKTITVSFDGNEAGARTITRALTEGGVKTFAAGDQIAVAYMNTSGNQVKAVTEALKSGDISGGKSAKFTVTFTEEPFESQGNYLYYTYPASITTDNGGINYSALNTQNGTLASLASNLDCCLAYAGWNGHDDLPELTLENQFAIGKFTIKYPNSDTDITSTITGMTVSDGTDTYTISRSAAAGPIWVAMQPIYEGSTVTITAIDGTNNYTKSVTIASGKDLEAGNIYPINVTMALVPSVPTDVINGLFSVSSTKQVYFSKGNLQYVSSQWKFADNQWSCLNTQSDGNRDLFGWGTANNPNQTSTNDSDYATFTDWGKNIGDGNTWRTLTNDEWGYIFSTRTDASQKYGHGSVGGVNGMIILPDMWTLPTGLSFTAGKSEWTNSYTINQWEQMEAAGAVFLPAAGYRSGSTVTDPGSAGRYWSSSPQGTSYAYRVRFSSNSLTLQDYSNHYYGFSVRLVKDAE